MQKNWTRNLGRITLAIIICQLAGAIGSIFTLRSVSTWYLELIKPSFNPPNWIFAPVWTTLFLLMGISLYLIWSSKDNKLSLRWFVIHLLLNVAWSALFFGLRLPLLALIEIILLWIAIFFTIKESYIISRISAYLLIPYLLWVSFASILNLAIVLLN